MRDSRPGSAAPRRMACLQAQPTAPEIEAHFSARPSNIAGPCVWGCNGERAACQRARHSPASPLKARNLSLPSPKKQGEEGIASLPWRSQPEKISIERRGKKKAKRIREEGATPKRWNMGIAHRLLHLPSLRTLLYLNGLEAIDDAVVSRQCPPRDARRATRASFSSQLAQLATETIEHLQFKNPLTQYRRQFSSIRSSKKLLILTAETKPRAKKLFVQMYMYLP